MLTAISGNYTLRLEDPLHSMQRVLKYVLHGQTGVTEQRSPGLCFVKAHHVTTKIPIPLQEEFPKSDSLRIVIYKNFNPEI